MYSGIKINIDLLAKSVSSSICIKVSYVRNDSPIEIVKNVKRRFKILRVILDLPDRMYRRIYHVAILIHVPNRSNCGTSSSFENERLSRQERKNIMLFARSYNKHNEQKLTNKNLIR